MRPRLVFLRDLVADLGEAARGRVGDRRRQPGRGPYSAGRPPQRARSEEERSAQEVSRRLDETRERLKREIPREPEAKG